MADELPPQPPFASETPSGEPAVPVPPSVPFVPSTPSVPAEPFVPVTPVHPPSAQVPIGTTTVSSTGPGTTAAEPAVTTTGLAPNIAAGIAALTTLIGGIVFLAIEKRDPFVRFWAMQSIFFGAAWFAVMIVCSIVGSMLRGIFWPLAVLWGLVTMVVYLGMLVLYVITLVKSFGGVEWEIPYLGKLARQQLAKMP